MLQRKHPCLVERVTDYVKNSRKRKTLDQRDDSANKFSKTSEKTIAESFLGTSRKLKQEEVDDAVSDFIVQGIHPLATVEQPAFHKLVSSNYNSDIYYLSNTL